MKDGKRVSVFSLREDTLPDLDATSVVVEEDRLASDDRLIDAEGREVEEADRFGSLTVGTAKCSTCGVEFEDHVEQREHFRSDWHRYNLSRREKKLSALTEEEFERLSDSVSISGSEDEADHSEDEMIALRSVRQSPMVEYPTPSGEYVSAWKAAIPTNGTLKDLKEVLDHQSFHRYTTRRKQGGEQTFNEKAMKAKSAGATLRRYNMKMLQEEVRATLSKWSGHIREADLIFLHAPGRGGRETFIGYDSSPLKGLDVRRVPMPMRRATYKEARRVFDELTSVYINKNKLIPPDRTILIAKEGAKPKAAIAVPKPPVKKEKGTSHLKQRTAKNAGPMRSGDEYVGSDLPQETVEKDRGEEAANVPVDPDVFHFFVSCCKGDVEEIKKCATSEKIINQEFPSGCVFLDGSVKVIGESMTPLCVVASLNHDDAVMTLLECGADPTIGSPYTLAKDKRTRDAFRKFWGRFPNRWDYVAAGIPTPLTDEMEAVRDAKAKEKKKRSKQRQKEKAKEAADAAAAAAAAAEELAAWECVPKPSRAEMVAISFALSVSLCISIPVFGFVSLARWITRRRLPEREKRALAMERRMRSGGSACRWCGKSLTGIIPFERQSYKYCSTDCVHRHRLELGG